MLLQESKAKLEAETLAARLELTKAENEVTRMRDAVRDAESKHRAAAEESR